MKKILTLIILTGFITGAYPQPTVIDSLKKELARNMPDTSRALTLADLSRVYLNFKPDSALVIAQEGLTLARQIKFPLGEISCLNTIGNVLAVIGNYPKALEILLEALKIAEHINDQLQIARANNNIGDIYFNQEDFSNALKYFYKAKNINEAYPNHPKRVIPLLNIGYTYLELNQLDSARMYTQQAYEFADRFNEREFRGSALTNLGHIHSRMGQYIIAKEYYLLGMNDSKSVNNNNGICDATLGLAELFKKSGQADSAVYYAKLSLTNAQNTGFIIYVLKASNFLGEYYKSKHNIDSAFDYQQITIAAKDSLFNNEKLKQLQTISFTETIRQQEKITDKLKAEQERKHNIQYAALAVSLLSFIVLYLLLSRSIIVTAKWIRFFGILGLLLVFEFVNLVIHPYLAHITNDSPVFMLLILVGIAALLIPLHHRLEKWITEKMVGKNKKIRLKAAKKIIASLEDDKNIDQNSK